MRQRPADPAELPSTLDRHARIERERVHAFALQRLAEIRATGVDPEAFAVALLAEAVALLRVLKGPDATAAGLIEMAAQIARTGGVAGHA